MYFYSIIIACSVTGINNIQHNYKLGSEAIGNVNVDLALTFRRNLESLKAALPAEKCQGASGKKPRGERRPYHREAELPAV